MPPMPESRSVRAELGSGAETVRCTLLPTSEERAWRLALDGLAQAFNHSLEANRAFEASTGLEVVLLVCEGATFRAACPLALRQYRGHRDVFTPPGFCGFASGGAMPDFAAVWSAAGQAFGWVCGYVQMHPMLPSVMPTPEPADPRVAYVLDLRQSSDELLRRMSQSRRRQCLRPMLAGTELRLSKEGAGAFLAREAPAFFAARQASPLMMLSPRGWDEVLASPDCIAVQALVDGDLHAVSLFGAVNTVADYLYNVSTPHGQAYSANLIWHAVAALKAKGVTSLNLGGGIRALDAIAEFKRRFGPDELSIPAIRTVFDQPLYDRLHLESGVSAATAYFPAYHSRDRN